MGASSSLASVHERGKIQRIHLLNIPIDVLPANLAEEVIEDALMANGSNQVVFLRVTDFMRARRNPEFRACLEAAALVLPVSMALVKAAKLLHLPVPVRYAPFDFVIRILNALERLAGTYYILGDHPLPLSTTEKNLRQTFPRAQTIGRYPGFFSPAMEPNIITAISRAAPNLLLLGPGVRGRNLWAYRARRVFRRGIQLWCGECFDYFALRQPRPNRVSFRKGREYFRDLMRSPWRTAKLAIFVLFQLAVLGARLRIHRPANAGKLQ